MTQTVEASSTGRVDLFDLTGKVALVTGAARGIGASIADQLAQRGASVVVVDVLDPAEAVESLRRAHPSSTFEGRVVDVRERSEVEAVVNQTVEQFGALDILVNNAGTASRTGLPEFTDEEWFRDIDTNLRGTFLFCQAALHPHMVERGSGTIINISSISGIMGGPTSGGEGGGRSGPAYASSKGGIIALTKWLAKEVGKHGITVNSVAPGPVATPMTGLVNYDFSQQLLQRMGTPEEIGAAVTFLASPGASYVTGQTLRVCGGAALG